MNNAQFGIIVDDQKNKDASPAKLVWEEAEKERKKKSPAQDKGMFDGVNWGRLAMMAGGGMLAHTLVSSLMNNKTEEEKRRETIWERLLSAIIPIGAMGLGAWGGKYLHSKIASAPRYYVEDSTNRIDQISEDIPYAKELLHEVYNSAGGYDKNYPLKPRMLHQLKNYLIPSTEKKHQDASDWRLYSALGAIPTGWGTWRAWKALDGYDMMENTKAIDEARIILDDNKKMTDYQTSQKKHDADIARKQQELAATKSKVKKQQIQQEIETLNKSAPVKPNVKTHHEADVRWANNTLENRPTTKIPRLRRNILRGAVVGGGIATAGLIGAAMHNHNVAEEQLKRQKALKVIEDQLSEALKNNSK